MKTKLTRDELLQKGINLWDDGCALVDTSGRTKQEKEKSLLALASKKVNYTVLMSSSEKKKVFFAMKKAGKGKSDAQTLVHAVKLYYALKDYIHNLPVFYICADGFNPSKLIHHLKNLLKDKYHEKKINIIYSLKPMFTKRNQADRLASKTIKNGKPTLTLTKKHFELLKLI